MTEQFTALTDAQVDQLAEWLDTLAIPNMGMNLEALDGFLTALVLSPEPIPFEEWETEVWGENAAAVDSGVRSTAQDLFLKHYRSIESRVEFDADDIPDELTPLMWLPQESDFNEAAADELEAGADWARGFFTGVGLREKEWDQWLDEIDFVEEIFMYLDQLESGEVMNPEDPTGAGEKVSFKERMEIIAALPTMMRDIRAHQSQANAAKVLQ